MYIEYKGQHSIIFFKDTGKGYTKRNSWIDFHMIPATRPYVTFGTPSVSQVVIPGSSKRVDITDYKPGGLTFGPRTGTWEFYIDHNKWSEWDKAYNEIKYYIHGNNFLINLTDDPYILYQGVLTVNGYVAGQNYSKITIQYDLMSETITLDEPIDFGDFGRLPDPKYIDTDGDGQPDAIDTDGDGEPDVELLHQKKLETCDGKVLYLPLEQEDWPSKFITDDHGYILGIDIDGDGTMDYRCITDSKGVYGLDYNCDGEVDVGQVFPVPPSPPLDEDPQDKLPDEDLTEEDEDGTVSITTCEGKTISGLPKNQTWWNTSFITDDHGYIIGIDINGDGTMDYRCITDSKGVYGLDYNCDGEVDEGKELPAPPSDQPEEDPQEHLPDEDLTEEHEDGTVSITTCEGKTISGLPKEQSDWSSKFITDDHGYILGIDIDGDGTMDYRCITDSKGVYGLDYNCDGEVDVGQAFPQPPSPPLDEDPEDKLPDEDLTEEDEDGTVSITTCEGKTISGLPKNQSWWNAKFITDNHGYIIGIDINGDGTMDYRCITDSKGVYGLDYNCDGEVDEGKELPAPPSDQPEEDPQEHLPDEDQTEDAWGVDLDCDGVIDYQVLDHSSEPKYIYDEDTGRLAGIDFDNDGVIDKYATPDEEGRWGVDIDCDGEFDTPPYTPPGSQTEGEDETPEPGQDDQEGGGDGEQPVVIGAYYPLLFITNSGESSMYGFASVSKSNQTLSVYDLYTIYESDKVVPQSSPDTIDLG